jgi:PAS domain S-box-containing protein
MLDFSPKPLAPPLTPDFFAGGGEMGERIRGHDWAGTALGPASEWSAGLKTAVRVMLASREPMGIWWGLELTNLYNDASRALIGGNHPSALGQPAPCAWREIWEDLGARVEGAIRGDELGSAQAVRLLVQRRGRVEEAHFTLSFTALPGDSGAEGGLLFSFTEITRSVVAERQLNLLKALATRVTGPATIEEACARSAEGLASSAADIPFAAIYLVDRDTRLARLASIAGITRGHAALPPAIAIDGPSPWPLRETLAGPLRELRHVMLADSRHGALPCGPWGLPPREAVVVALGPAGSASCTAVLIAALNPFHVLSDEHRRFIELVAAQVAAAFAAVAPSPPAGEGQRTSRELVDVLPAAVYTTDAQGHIEHYNQAAVALWGREPHRGVDRWCGSSALLFPDGEAMAHEGSPMARILQGERAQRASEIVIERPDGSQRHAIAHPCAIRDEHGHTVGAVNMLVDITERKASEAELAFTKDQLALQVESLTKMHELAMHLGGMTQLQPALQLILDAAVDSQDADFGLLWLQDPRSERLVVHASHGFDAEQLERFGSLMPGTQGGSAGNAFAQRRRWVVEDTETDPVFAPFRESARLVGLRAVHSTPIVTRSGALLGVLSVHYAESRTPLQREMQVADVCARHAADAIEAFRNEEALRESERMYRAVGESMDFGVWTADGAGRNTFLSESFLRLTGTTFEECAGEGWARVVHPDDVAEMLAKWTRCVSDGSLWEHEYRVKGIDGEWHPVLGRAVALRNEHGVITGWAGINLDIARQKRVENELRELDQRKNEFLATLAHELRNPLAPIRNGLEVMRLAKDSPETVEKARGMMERQLGQMVRLVDDLLDVSRVSRGKIELRRSEIELAAVLRNAVETSQPLINERGHKLEVHIPEERILLDADMTRMAQVFANLLNNAAKYTDAGGRIVLSVLLRDGRATVSVKDNGIGIPPDMLASVFDIFTQVDRGLEKSQGGLGIGLSIAKRLVEMHGGTIEVRSAGNRLGSEFIVSLPARMQASATSRPETARAANDSRADAPRHRILVADDNSDSATTLSLMLRMMGHEVRVARDGQEAVESAAEFAPDAILLDIGMPRMNGYEACEAIRRQSPGVYIVALTGWGQDEDKNRARAAGFDRHLVKPVEPLMLERMLEDLPPSGGARA